MPGDGGLQVHEEDVFVNGLPPLSSCATEITTAGNMRNMACVETELAKQTRLDQ